mmetsp:Transcript_11657/g.31348  ORF Transcript_11657/g.31348 Transcript_11657/m.31348 type:complete len:160 (+) Transcript_11657:760-1239(+)
MQLAVTAHECDDLGVYLCGFFPSLPPSLLEKHVQPSTICAQSIHTSMYTSTQTCIRTTYTHSHTHANSQAYTSVHAYTYARTYKRARKTTGVLMTWKSTYAYNRSRSYRTTKTQCVPTCLSSTCDALWCARRREREGMDSLLSVSLLSFLFDTRRVCVK